ncbi:MAG: response regulator [Bdellovibrionales bacterium]|nr:response regulator [Bdellovibrionales bacterium]
MKLSSKKLNSSIEELCFDFGSKIVENLKVFFQLESKLEKRYDKELFVSNQNNLHVSILFSGSVYGEFILTLDKNTACEIFEVTLSNYEIKKTEIFESLKEIVNISVGNTMDLLSKNFSYVSITSPKVSVGEIYLPMLPIETKSVFTKFGYLYCSIYIDQMGLSIAREFSNSSEKLKDVEKEKEHLKQLSSTKSEFLANMSHELRTPLNGIIGYLDLLKQTELSNTQRHQVDTIAQSGEFLLGIIDDILEFTKIESGRLQIENRKFNLVESVEKFIDIISKQVYDKGLDFVVNIDPALPAIIESDETRIRQVLMNLVGNSIKFTPRGSINIDIKLADNKILFSVKDTGIGIPKNKLLTIFDSFTQADLSDNRKYGGSGLGLSISKSILEAMGGYIQVESVEAMYTNFLFSIPYDNQNFESVKDRYVIKTNDMNIKYFVKNETLISSLDVFMNKWLNSNKIVSKLTGEGNLEFSNLDVLFVEGALWKTLPTTKVQDIIKNCIENKVKLILTILPSDIVDFESKANMFNAVKGTFLTKPITPIKLLQALNKEDYLFTKQQLPKRKIEKSGKGRVLVAEDNLINQQVAKAMLEVLGLDVEIASNGVEALDLSLVKKFDIIFMDCQMPVMDGYSVTESIRSDKSNCNVQTPIIALTANAFREIKERCYECGMDDFTTKPIKQIDLAKIVQKYFAS